MIKKTSFILTAIITIIILANAPLAFAGMLQMRFEGADAFRYMNELTFTIYADETKAYSAEIEHLQTGIEGMSLEVNGLPVPLTGEKCVLPLRRGINTVCFVDAEISALIIDNIAEPAKYGASVPYTAYEAEDAVFEGTLSNSSREYRTMSSEASARRYVSLTNKGDYVSFTLTEPANALVLRCSIPDSDDGKGLDSTLSVFIDGEPLTVFKLTSRYSWSYGEFPWTNNPSDGNAHQFFDDARMLLDRVYPAGTVVTLMRDENDTAAFYNIDLLEAEFVDAPIEQPVDCVSVLEYGAVPDDGEDDTAAFADCIRDAGKIGKTVWIPAGEFNLTSSVFPHGIDIRTPITIMGAGMWHTILQGKAAAFYMRSSDVTMRDFSLYGDCIIRDDSIYPSALESDINQVKLEGFRLYNLWIEHHKVGMWVNTVRSIHMSGCRIRNTYADGINLRKASSYCTIEQNDFRSNGDDAIAGWSAVANNTGNIIRSNSIALPWLANGIALYGGADIKITDNLIRDTIAFGAGINISTNFNPAPFTGNITISKNYLLRCGSVGYGEDDLHGAVWFNTVEGTKNEAKVYVIDNIIADSTYYGVSFSGAGEIYGADIYGNSFLKAKHSAVYIAPEAKGVALFVDNICEEMMSGEVTNKGSFDLVTISESPVNDSIVSNASDTVNASTVTDLEPVKDSSVDEQKSLSGYLLLLILGGAAVIGAGVFIWYKFDKKYPPDTKP